MKTLIKNGTIVNNGQQFRGHILIDGDTIAYVGGDMPDTQGVTNIIDAENQYVIPGVIDGHVHFREPGLTHKADFESESKAAVAGGVTSFLDMPNVVPQTTTNQLLNERIELAAQKSVANFGFYLGATNNNIEEIRKADITTVCGIKVFMGSSTGNMLVDENNTLEQIFAESPCPITVHCEDEQIIKANIASFKERFGDKGVLPSHHPLIRTAEACYKSTAKAIELAHKYGTRLHIAHLSTAAELALLEDRPMSEKTVTAETCPHYLFFDSNDYETLGYRIKCNPAIKSPADRQALLLALNTNKIDTIATDHAPHQPSEKFGETYFTSASGMPSVQFSLLAMLELCRNKQTDIETVVRKMCHAPADLYRIAKRGYLQSGYKADIAIVDINKPQTITADTVLSKCKWSPFEGHTFSATVTHTFVNGNLVYRNGEFVSDKKGEALRFNR
ncbi:MAG: dihydroorotase [Salinivirgaceae bacterium]|nr:dihydroorotase [Salinivirgaceae bacterium]